MEPLMDVAVTATLQPEMLKKTLNSFTAKLFGGFVSRCRLVINVDPTGHKDEKDKSDRILEIYEVVGRTPFREVDISLANVPSFPVAFHWCVKNIRTPLFFYIEEGWEMKQNIDFERMFYLFEEFPELNHLRLSSNRSKEKSIPTGYDKSFWNGSFFEIPEDLKDVTGVILNPSLNRTCFFINCYERIHPMADPAKQLSGRNPWIKPILDRSRFGVFHEPKKDPSIISLIENKKEK